MGQKMFKAIRRALAAFGAWFEPASRDDNAGEWHAREMAPVYQAYEAISLGSDQYSAAVSRLTEAQRVALAEMLDRAIAAFGTAITPEDYKARERLIWARTGL